MRTNPICSLLAVLLLSAPAAVASGPTAGTAMYSEPTVLQSSEVPEFARRYLLNGGYVAAGVGMRNRGEGTITLAVPDGAEIVDAFLYFTILDDSDKVAEAIAAGHVIALIRNPSNDTILLEVNARKDPVALIGQAGVPCWPGATSSFSYRVDIANAVRSGTADYKLDFKGTSALVADLTGDTSGNPFVDGSNPPMLEGASIVVIYRHAEHPLTQIVIHDGNFLSNLSALSGSTEIDIFPQRGRASARTTFIGADGQATAFGPESLVDNELALNDAGASLAWEGGDNLGVDPGDDFCINPSLCLGRLWDTLTTEEITLSSNAASVVTGIDNLRIINGRIDCVVWLAQILAVEQRQGDGCRAPFFFGSDTNINLSESEGCFPARSCNGRDGRNDLFYLGRLGAANTESGSWACCIQQPNNSNSAMYCKRSDTLNGSCSEPGLESCQFELAAAHLATPENTYAYWGLAGPDFVGNPSIDDNCTGVAPRDISEFESALALGEVDPANVPADEELEELFRLGECQAQVFHDLVSAQSDVVGGDVLFGDIEGLEGWLPCVSIVSGGFVEHEANCIKNRAVLVGFLKGVESLSTSYVPGIYTGNSFWNSTFELRPGQPPAMRDIRTAYDPGIDFVLWITGVETSCDQSRDRAIRNFPNVSLGGMRPVVWQYQEACKPCSDEDRAKCNGSDPPPCCKCESDPCLNDYDITDQHPSSFRPVRVIREGQVVYHRDGRQ